MINHLWFQKLGEEIIDISILPSQRMLALADVSGGLIACDYFGTPLWKCDSSQPAWGVDIALNEFGEIVSALACADKQSNSGTCLFFKHDELVAKFEANSPVWDVVLSPNGDRAYFSTWSGSIIIIPLML